MLPNLFDTQFKWGQSGLFWGQSGLFWGQLDYTALITSEHVDQPKFNATVAAFTQPLVDVQAAASQLPEAFDLDAAIGVQLDAVGEWVGVARQLTLPLTGVYFAFGIVGQGFGQGVWRGPNDPTAELDTLDDTHYRILLKSKIGNNSWDGTIPAAYDFMAELFPSNTFFIQDNGDMSMWLGLLGTDADAVTTALFTEGYLDIRPMGITIRGYLTPSVSGAPLFGFGVNNTSIAGFGDGVWATVSGRT